MADFSHLKELDVAADKTAEFTLHQITVNGRTPVLVVAPATEANKPYFNALLKRAGKAARQMKAGNISADLLEKNRDEDKELYPRYVLKGWRDMVDAGGAEVPFSAEEASNFVEALPNWLFDELRNFCGNPTSFADFIDVEVSAKNSRSGSSSS